MLSTSLYVNSQKDGPFVRGKLPFVGDSPPVRPSASTARPASTGRRDDHHLQYRGLLASDTQRPAHGRGIPPGDRHYGARPALHDQEQLAFETPLDLTDVAQVDHVPAVHP
jgi:hypothetical protein